MADVVAIRIKANAKQAKQELKGLGRGFTDLGAKAKKANADLFLVTAAVAALGAAVVATGFAIVKNAADVAILGDEIAKTARIVGVSADQFQVLRFAADRSGVSMRSVSSGMKKLSKSLFEASTVGGTMADTFEGMGIAFEDGNGNLRDSFAVLKDVADRMKRLGVTTQTTAEAQVVLGRAGADLTNLLLEGSIGLVEYEARLRAIGGLMSADLLAASEAFQDSLTDLDFAFLGLKASLAESVIPGLTDFVNFTAEIVIPELKELAEVVKTVGSGIIDDLRPALEMIGDMLTGRGFGSTKRALDTFKAIRGISGPTSTPSARRGSGSGRRGGGSATAKAAKAAAPMRDGVFGDPIFAEQTDLLNFLMEQDDKKIALEAATQASLKVIRDAALAEDLRRAEERQRVFQDTQNAQTQAASAAFGSIETFAGMAQSAVEDSYFGQTKAGRTAAKALFVAGKAAALANAIVNTAQAVTNALAVQPYPLGAALAVSAGIAGGTQIGTIVGTTIQGIADAGLAPGALRSAGLNQHTAIAVGPDETVIDPRGTADISRMLNLQRRQMEMAAQGGANGGPTVVVAELDGRRVSRALSGPMTADLEDGHDFRRNVRMGVA